MQLQLAISVPFVERTVLATDNKTSIIVGVKTYSESEILALKEELMDIRDSSSIDRLQNKIQQLVNDTTISEEEYSDTIAEYKNSILELSRQTEEKAKAFYKRHVLFFKNVKFNEPVGLVKDTRTAAPIDGLWATSEECLQVLTDILFEQPPFRSSLYMAIMNAIFETGKKK